MNRLYSMMLRQVVGLIVVLFTGMTALPGAAQSHFEDCAGDTGSNATVVLHTDSEISVAGRTLETGDEVAAFTSTGTCAGVAVWTGENVALKAWGDDPFTPETDGFADGEPISFRVWSRSHRAEYAAVEVVFDSTRPHLRSDGRYGEDAIYVVERLAASGSDDPRGDVMLSEEAERAVGFQLEQNYPNPFYDTTVIAYQLAAPGQVQLDVLNVQGQRVRRLQAQHQSVGRHTAVFDADDLPSGLYLVRLTSGGQTQVRRMVLLGR